MQTQIHLSSLESHLRTYLLTLEHICTDLCSNHVFLLTHSTADFVNGVADLEHPGPLHGVQLSKQRRLFVDVLLLWLAQAIAVEEFHRRRQATIKTSSLQFRPHLF